MKEFFRKIGTIPGHLKGLWKNASAKDLYRVFRYVKPISWKDALVAIAQRNNPKVFTFTEFGSISIQAIRICDNFTCHEVEKGIFKWTFQGNNFFGTKNHFEAYIYEFCSGAYDKMYCINWSDKRVLDIGAYSGDTAKYFLAKGAKKIVLVEPVPDNLLAIRYNVKIDKQKTELIEGGLHTHNETFIITSEAPFGDMGFGMRKGTFTLSCQGFTIEALLNKKPFDVVKVDCEGGEEALVEAEDKVLQSVPYWIIETHHPKIYEKIENKFKQAGFKQVKNLELSPDVSLLHYQK